jgi:hypothetical protein
MIVYRDKIDEKFSTTDNSWDKKGGNKHLSNPSLAAHSRIQTAAEITIDW